MRSSARDLTCGIAIGAGLMFLFDPRRGGARRAIVRQKSARAAHEVEEAFGIGARDLSHRVSGIASLAFGKRRPANATDDVLVARVRSKLGRLSRHPHAIEVVAKGDGMIELRGPVLRDDVERVLSGISHVRGVRAIDDDLDVHETAEDVPGLQGGDRRVPTRPLFTPATRLVLGLAAAGLSLASFLKGYPLGLLAGGAAVIGLSRNVTSRGGGARRPLLRRSRAPRGLREAYPPGSEWAPSVPT